MDGKYEATWLPLSSVATQQDSTEAAVEYMEQQCKRAGVRGVLLTYQRRDAATPSLRRFAEQNGHVTIKSRTDVVPGGCPVLVDMPDARLLADAHRLARGSLSAIESGAFSLHGWASATNAVDITTGAATNAPSSEVMDLFDALIFAGNNGWADKPGERDARRLLAELQTADPTLDGHFIAGYLIANGAGRGVEKLLTLIP